MAFVLASPFASLCNSSAFLYTSEQSLLGHCYACGCGLGVLESICAVRAAAPWLVLVQPWKGLSFYYCKCHSLPRKNRDLAARAGSQGNFGKPNIVVSKLIHQNEIYITSKGGAKLGRFVVR